MILFWLNWSHTCRHLWASRIRTPADKSKIVKLPYIWHNCNYQISSTCQLRCVDTPWTLPPSQSAGWDWRATRWESVSPLTPFASQIRTVRQEQLLSSARVSALRTESRVAAEEGGTIWFGREKASSKVDIGTGRLHLNVHLFAQFAQRLC